MAHTLRVVLASLTFLSAAAGCGSPDTETLDMCGPDGTCPIGFECNTVDRRCYKSSGTGDPDAAPDAPGPVDAPPPLACPAPTHGPTTHASQTLTTDTTWTADTGPHLVTGDLRLDGATVLTLEACTVVQLAASATVSVGVNGGAARLVAAGEAGREVRFEARDAQPWSFVRFTYPGSGALAYTRLSGGGADRFQGYATLSLIGDRMPRVRPMVAVDHVTITGSQGFGARLISGAGFTAGSTGLDITGSGAGTAADVPGQPISVGVQSAGTLPPGSYGGNRADEIVLDGDATITEDVTLADLGLPYVAGVGADVRVRGATMTLAAGVQVKLRASQQWAVGATTVPPTGGALVAAGTAEKPVRLTALVPDAHWGNLTAQSPGVVSLTHTILEDGGEDRFRSYATLVAWGDGTLPLDRVLFVDHVTILRSRGAGVRVERSGAFAEGSTDLTITASGGDEFGPPLHVATPAVGTIPSGSYTGNRADHILVDSQAIVDSDTFADHGVPYVLPLSLSVAPPDTAHVASLTIDPGVTLRFGANAYLNLGVGSSASEPRIGVLRAVGTAEQPIVFTADSAAPAAGFWRGLTFSGLGDDQNRIDHARIEYAGADCLCGGFGCPTTLGEDAAIIFYNYRPPSAFITNTTFAHVSGHGVTSGWTSDLDGPDFRPTNTFEDVAGCAQVRWRSPTSACPADPCL